MVDLTDPNWAYLFGFLQSDGHMAGKTGHKGRIQIEIKSTDEIILHKIKSFLTINSSVTSRSRITNFGQNNSSILTICDMQLRDELNELGLPYGKKCYTIKPPTVEFSKPDYFRGLIDGDGSLGTTAKNYPFLSFITVSELLAQSYNDFLTSLTGKLKTFSKTKGITLSMYVY